MKDKEKQIEEMSDIIFNSRYKNDYISPLKGANELYNAGYRKIDKDSVVLSRKEYEKYKKVADGKAIMVENITDLNKLVQFPIEYDSKMFDYIDDFGNYVQEQARKETAEKILEYLHTYTMYFDDIENVYKITISISKSELDELEKLLGVKIKE